MSARKMKDSGIEWIGEIPEEWEISKVSYFYKISLGKMLQPNAKEESDTLENYLCALNVFWNKITTDNIKQMWFAKSEKKQYELTAGDLIVTEGGDVAAACIWEGEVNPCYIQNAVYRVRSLPGFLNKYLYYHLFVAKTTGYIDMLCNKATIAHFTKDKFSNLPFIVLPLDEQQKIVAHLDEKCGEIDKVVVSKQKQNEQLAAYRQSLVTEAVTKGLNPAAPMKDSDIEWIGEIPEEWQVRKLFNLLETIGGGTTPKDKNLLEDEGDIPWLNTGDLNDSYIYDIKRTVKKEALDEYSALKVFTAEAIVIAMYGATIGKLGIATDKFTTNQACCVLVAGEELEHKFLFYSLMAMRENIIALALGGGQPNISQDIVKSLRLPLPPLSEQKAIAAYLDKKCGEIDALSEHNKNIIESLQEYKQSLIYEAVTGKIEL
jgi:type I restriction enzyme S subunit